MNIVAERGIPTAGLRRTFISRTGEWLFALFLFAGYYKPDPRLAFIQARVDITLLFLILSLLVFLYRLFGKPSAQRIPSGFAKVAALFLLLAACLLGGLLITQSEGYGLEKTTRFIVLTGWAFYGAAFLITGVSSLRRFSWAIVTISTAMAIDAVLAYSGRWHLAFVTALGSNYIALARSTGLGFLTTVAFLLPTGKRFLGRLLLSGVAALQLWALLSSGARGPVLALILSILLFFALSVRGFARLRIERFALRFGVLVLFVFVAFAVIGQELFSTLIFRSQVALTEGGTSVMTRLSLYQSAIELWANSPIWGNGTGRFGIAIEGQDIRSYPHNIVLELGAEVGFIGVLVFAMMIGATFVKPLVTLGAQRGLAKTATRYLLVACCFALANAMVSGDINDNRMLFTWIALLASVHRFQKGKAVSPNIDTFTMNGLLGREENKR